ncbi:NAD(P)H-dependent oxidoreductase [Aurantiacibacter rhizosphaerae]|uniref:Flavodoxin family protein n=1 Tax=Aurantiacibacter rhizosphaerae TaxID=2691582 RepID=A0A844XHP9_9SPHN|nr:NAD(P)H-dependent oxidoreductase [Aurantiacibacter rhizosphaerae]MWV29075.1 flavodoxin family protein [Aurantiacibacter rhizosphaerae]
MKTLLIFGHPVPGTYPFAVLEAATRTLQDQGDDVEVLDLYEDGFDPRFTKGDHAHFWGGPKPHDVARYHDMVDRADRLVFVYPVYWWGMPAIMKGWIERVFTGDWAYVYGGGVSDRGQAGLKGLLQNRPTLLLAIGGSTQGTYTRYGYDEAMRTNIDVGVFSYCGIRDVTSHILFNVEGDANAQRRADYLGEVRDVVSEFVDPDREPRDAKEWHFRESE